MDNLLDIIERGSPDIRSDHDSPDIRSDHDFTVPEGLCIFTPGVDETGTRLRLCVTPEDVAKIPRGKGWTATVTDVPTGLLFDVASAPCGAGCHCAARVTAIRFP